MDSQIIMLQVLIRLIISFSDMFGAIKLGSNTLMLWFGSKESKGSFSSQKYLTAAQPLPSCASPVYH